MYLEAETGGRIVANSLPGLHFGSTNFAQPPGPTPFNNQNPSQMNPYEGYYNRAGYGGNEAFNPSLYPQFNWGAFLLTWIWGLNHKQPITLLSLGVSVVGFFATGIFGVLCLIANFGLGIYFGMYGYKWAWESGRFSTPEECRSCQATWGWWGLALIIICCLTISVFTAAGIVMFRDMF